MNHSDSKELFPQPWIPGVSARFQDAVRAADMVPLATTPKLKHEAIRKCINEILKALRQSGA